MCTGYEPFCEMFFFLWNGTATTFFKGLEKKVFSDLDGKLQFIVLKNKLNEKTILESAPKNVFFLSIGRGLKTCNSVI
jgi:hypothetical protein